MRPILLAILLSLAASAQTPAPTAADLLARGSLLVATKPAEAVKLLQLAVQLDPDLPGLRYQLGLAYHAIGDEADAAVELREAITSAPDSPSAHNFLGIALFSSGDAKAALEEFRAVARLAPKDPNAHFNLGEAMARTGDSAAAIDELRIASQLAPTDAGLARLLTSVEGRAGSIKVEVRQVLVPVVVTDPEGHHVNGLTQDDFTVLEDGVEQKITAFTVEHSGAPQDPIPQGSAAPVPASKPTPAAAAKPRPRRTYMVLIDTLHTSFRNLAAAREALVKLFQQEHSPDSQYVVVALGVSPEMILNVTSDPAAVLAALSAKRLQKVFSDGQLGSPTGELERFRRELTETRVACDLAITDTVAKAKCSVGLQHIGQRAQLIAEMDRAVTVGFLRQFRSLVAQLAPARDRRTILLISDGFAIEPGKEVADLRRAYFPQTSHCNVPADVFCPSDTTSLSATRMSEEFEPVLKLAAAANITIDTIDSRGLAGQSEFDASTQGTTASLSGAIGRIDRDAASAAGNTLREVAAATGGTALHDNNDLFGGMQRAFADARDYYTLAYVSTNAEYDGKFRAITVQVRKRSVAVNAKRGYWAAP